MTPDHSRTSPVSATDERDAPTVFASPGALLDAGGTRLGPTEWLTVDQERIDRFADATGDHQWIHTDPVRAASGPFGATIAHGYLTLALANWFLPRLVRVDGISMGVNYGIDKARFPAPVRVGSRLRGVGEIGTTGEIPGGVQAVIRVAIELEGSDKPAAVVDTVSRFLV